jgi:hypothetical protein
MSRPRDPGLTPLQEWLTTFRLLVEDARHELGPDEWMTWVWIVCDVIGNEVAHLAVDEAMRILEDEAA